MAGNEILKLKPFLDEQVARFNKPDFIVDDPVSIPHLFKKKQDIEIAGFFAAILAWGQRSTILKKCAELLLLMEHDPHEFVVNHSAADLRPFESFRHRTFNGIDAVYFIQFLSQFYQKNSTLENAFAASMTAADEDTGTALRGFHEHFFSLGNVPVRTRKHISTPLRKSACKRLNMYLRWMVRNDENGVDFGLWNRIKPAQLVCPLDLHVERTARELGLLSRKNVDWQAALELTRNLRTLDQADPVKYDYALFGLSVSKST